MKSFCIGFDGRWLTALLLVLYLAWILSATTQNQARLRWVKMGVPATRETFLDTRFILAVFEAHRAGLDPVQKNPFDPRQRGLNYPKLWLWLTPIGLDLTHTEAAGWALAILYFAVFLLAAGRQDVWGGLGLSLFLTSPAVMFGMERGNLDLLMATLLGLAVILVRRCPAGGYGAILLAGLLKLYPMAGLLLVLREKKRTALLWAAGLLLAFGCYLAMTWADLRTISEISIRTWYHSYGRLVLFLWWNMTQRIAGQPGVPIELARMISWIIFALASLAGWLWARQLSRPASANTLPNSSLDTFRVGAGMFVGTYAMTCCFNYKFVFVVFMVPQLIAWSRSLKEPVDQPLGWTARIVLLLLLLSAWASFPLTKQNLNLILPIEETVNWLLFSGTLALLLATLPPWLRRARNECSEVVPAFKNPSEH